MHRYLIPFLLLTTLAIAALAQDPAPEDADAAAETAAADDADLDEQGYADAEDDDFRPSEDIPADQSIAFPTDI